MMHRKQVAMFALCLAMFCFVNGALSSCAPKQKAPLASESIMENSVLDEKKEDIPLVETEPAKISEVEKVVAEEEEEDLSNHDYEPALDVKDGTFLSQIFDYQDSTIEEILQTEGFGITLGKERSSKGKDFLTVRTSQKQFESLKNQGVSIERKYLWIRPEKEISKQSIGKDRPFERDPYQKLKEEYKEMGYHYLSRFYLDITGEGVPELFIMTYGGTGGSSYLVYQIEPDGYLFVGEMHFRTLHVLHEKTHGFHDLIFTWRGGSVDRYLTLMQFNGYEYQEIKNMVATEDDYEEILTLDSPYLMKVDMEAEQLGETFHWSARDDDKYRWK